MMKRKLPKTFTIRGRKHTVGLLTGKLEVTCDGYYAPHLLSVKLPSISINGGLSYGKRRAETLIHEALHAAFPQWGEKKVTYLAADLMRLLVLSGEIK